MLSQIDDILLHTLSVDDAVDWESLKRKDKYSKPKPNMPKKKAYHELPSKPEKESSEFIPQFTFLEKVLKSKKQIKIDEFDRKYSNAVNAWELKQNKIDEKNKRIDEGHEKDLESWELKVKEWEAAKDEFYQKRKEFNIKIDEMKKIYLDRNPDSITEYCEMVLNNSEYPDFISKDFELEYNPNNEMLILEYQLPALEDFPNVKEVKYIAARKTLKESYLSDTEVKKRFDDALYKIALRTAHEFFSEKDNLKERILTSDEEALLLEKSPDYLKPILIFALNTGMRKGEILNLEWSRVDLENGLVKVENTKGGRTRYININTELSALLYKMQSEDVEEEFVFSNPSTGKPYSDVKGAFKKACNEADISGLRFHDLRHTFASRLVESGADLITVKELLGHSTVKMTERYTHSNQTQKKNAVELLVKRARKAPNVAQICHTRQYEETQDVVSDSN